MKRPFVKLDPAFPSFISPRDTLPILFTGFTRLCEAIILYIIVYPVY